MIVFDLRCRGGHVFEGWFGSSADYDQQRQHAMVACPICGSTRLEKAPMAPNVGKGAEETGLSPDVAKKALAELASAQRKLLAGSEHVGDRFPQEARAIHLGEAEARAIHGRATADDAKSLVEDGIPVSPLPFPVPEPGEEN
ncbi:MAG: DUF1178 family protein [Sphingosinicella sp.]